MEQTAPLLYSLVSLRFPFDMVSGHGDDPSLNIFIAFVLGLCSQGLVLCQRLVEMERHSWAFLPWNRLFQFERGLAIC